MPYSGPIVDAHHHIWRLADVPWLAGPILPRIFGEYAPIKRDYLVDEYLRDVRAAGVEQSVYVQCNWPNDRAIDEVAWVQSVSDQHGFPHGIVGFADFPRQIPVQQFGRGELFEQLFGPEDGVDES